MGQDNHLISRLVAVWMGQTTKHCTLPHIMQNLPNPGIYNEAALAGQIVIYVTDKGALCAALPVQIIDGELIWQSKYTAMLINADGVPNENNLSSMREIFGWDGQDPFALSWEDPETQQIPKDLSGVKFSATCGHEEYNGRTTFKIKWINPPGKSSRIPAQADRKEILSRFGAQFRALSAAVGKSPAATPPPTNKAKPAPEPEPAEQPELPAANPTTAPAPAQKTASPRGRTKPAAEEPTATMQECWAALMKKNPNAKKQSQEAYEETLNEAWFALIDELFGEGKDNADLTPQNWGKLLAKLK